jgi:PAS domain S-box-containing protein
MFCLAAASSDPDFSFCSLRGTIGFGCDSFAECPAGACRAARAASNLKRQRRSPKQPAVPLRFQRHKSRRADLRVLSDALFRVFVDSVDNCAIYTMDPRGFITSWNQGAERVKGYTAKEIIGRNYSCFFTPRDRRAGKPEKLLKLAAEQGRIEEESRRVRKDGSPFWAGTVLTAIETSKGRLLGFAKVTRDITARMKAEEELRRTNAQLAAEVRKRQAGEREVGRSAKSLRELSLRLMRAQDEERRRIGRELHDSVGQYLSMLKMHLESLDVSPNHKPSQLAEEIGRCVRLADDSLKEVRTVSHLLYPPTLEEMGLKSAFPWYLDGFSRRSGIQTTLEMGAGFSRLPADVEVALFRVLQEALNNVHRHSGSNRAFIRLYMRGQNVNLHVRDFGKGVPAALLDESSKDWMGSQGVGLRGMRERMRQLGGDLQVISDKHGTEIHASIPVEAAAAASGSSG